MLIKNYVIIFLFFIVSYSFASDTDVLLNKILKKYSKINDVYAEIVTNGFNENNESTELNMKYWFSTPNKVKKISTNKENSVLTIINKNTLLTYYKNAKTLIKTNLSDLSDTEKKIIDMQNYVFNFIKFKWIKQNLIVDDISNDSIGTSVLFHMKNTQFPIKNIIVYLDKNKNLNQMKINLLRKQTLYVFDVKFKKIDLSPKLTEKEFQFNLKDTDITTINASDFN